MWYLHVPGGPQTHQSLFSVHICLAHNNCMWGFLYIHSKVLGSLICTYLQKQCNKWIIVLLSAKYSRITSTLGLIFAKFPVSLHENLCFSDGLKQGASVMDVNADVFPSWCHMLPVLAEMPPSLSPTGVSGPQSSAQRWGLAGCGPAADVIRPHFGSQRNLQWGGGRNAQHPLWVSPGKTNAGRKTYHS